MTSMVIWSIVAMKKIIWHQSKSTPMASHLCQMAMWPWSAERTFEDWKSWINFLPTKASEGEAKNSSTECVQNEIQRHLHELLTKHPTAGVVRLRVLAVLFSTLTWPKKGISINRCHCLTRFFSVEWLPIEAFSRSISTCSRFLSILHPVVLIRHSDVDILLRFREWTSWRSNSRTLSDEGLVEYCREVAAEYPNIQFETMIGHNTCIIVCPSQGRNNVLLWSEVQ